MTVSGLNSIACNLDARTVIMLTARATKRTCCVDDKLDLTSRSPLSPIWKRGKTVEQIRE